MAKTERERLKWAARLLQKWRPEYDLGEVDSVFLHLDELDRSENADLWRDVREALATNEAFQAPSVRRYLRVEKWAREGRWWHNPDEWRVPAEVA